MTDEEYEEFYKKKVLLDSRKLSQFLNEHSIDPYTVAGVLGIALHLNGSKEVSVEVISHLVAVTAEPTKYYVVGEIQEQQRPGIL